MDWAKAIKFVSGERRPRFGKIGKNIDGIQPRVPLKTSCLKSCGVGLSFSLPLILFVYLEQVSPIMGPVLAFTFGTNVRDWSLAKKGFLVEVRYTR